MISLSPYSLSSFHRPFASLSVRLLDGSFARCFDASLLRSEQYEARLSLVRVEASPSVLLSGMEGSHLPIVVAHGEGRAQFASADEQASLESAGLEAMRFIDHNLQVAGSYPYNPNGSPDGITGLCNEDGRITIMMPHPERVFRAAQLSWCPSEWQTDSGWMRLFRNARVWLE